MKRLRENKHMLFVLKNADTKTRKYLLKRVNCEVIKTIAEIAYNTLVGNNTLTAQTRNSLYRYKKELRALACLNRKITSKRRIVIQKGGFLPILLGTVLSGVIGAIIDNYGNQKRIN